MRETKYNWIEAIRMMLDGKFMSVGVVYRIQDNELSWYEKNSDTWVKSNDSSLMCYEFHMAEDPQPKYVDCTWQEACALRAFMRDPADEIVIKCNDLSWAVHFGWSPGFRDSDKWKFKMLRKYYDKYFG